MSEMMEFPETWEEFEKSYGFTDNEEVYTNGARLIPSFRVKQWLDHLPSVQSELSNNSTKLDNENGELISRQAAIDALKICDNNEDGINCHKCPLRDERWDGAWEDNETNCYTKLMRDSAKLLELPSAQPDLQPTCNQLATDCISRQGAIDAIVKCTNCNTPEVLKEYVAEHSLWSLWSGGVLEALEAVEGLPSAQPEEHTETHACDCISRQDAIIAVRSHRIDINDPKKIVKKSYEDVIKELPSAQLEIIRCKDCKHGIDYYHEGDCYCSNPKWELTYFGGSWEFYCGDAERREE